MKATKQSRSNHDDELTIEDVIELGGDQVSALYKLISVAIVCLLPHELPKLRIRAWSNYATVSWHAQQTAYSPSVTTTYTNRDYLVVIIG